MDEFECRSCKVLVNGNPKKNCSLCPECANELLTNVLNDLKQKKRKEYVPNIEKKNLLLKKKIAKMQGKKVKELEFEYISESTSPDEDENLLEESDESSSPASSNGSIFKPTATITKKESKSESVIKLKEANPTQKSIKRKLQFDEPNREANKVLNNEPTPKKAKRPAKKVRERTNSSSFPKTKIKRLVKKVHSPSKRENFNVNYKGDKHYIPGFV